MIRDSAARAILVVDAVGCAAAAALLAASPPVARTLGVSGAVQGALVAALGATSASLGAGAVENPPSDRALERAAGVNIAWVAVCLAGLTRRPRGAAAGMIATTAVADGLAAAIQWSLRTGGGTGRANGS